MKQNTIKFNQLIAGMIDVEDFYTMSISEYEISFQGYYVPTTVLKYESKGFAFAANPDSGYMEATIDNVKITLTDKA